MGPPKPPYLISQLAAHPGGGRVKLTCGACAWTRSYSAPRIAERLEAKGLARTCRVIADVARHVRWPCPACGARRWVTAPLEFHRRGQRLENPTLPPRPA